MLTKFVVLVFYFICNFIIYMYKSIKCVNKLFLKYCLYSDKAIQIIFCCCHKILHELLQILFCKILMFLLQVGKFRTKEDRADAELRQLLGSDISDVESIHGTLPWRRQKKDGKLYQIFFLDFFFFLF